MWKFDHFLLALLFVTLWKFSLACHVCAPVIWTTPSRNSLYGMARGPTGVGLAAWTHLIEQRPALVFGVALLHRVVYHELQRQRSAHTHWRSSDDYTKPRSDETSSDSDGESV